MNPFEPGPEAEPPRPSADVRGLVVVRTIELGWSLVAAVLFVVLPRVGFPDAVFGVISTVWLLLAVATIAVMVPLVRSLSGHAAEGMAKAAMGVAVLSLLFEGAQRLTSLHGEATILLAQALFVAGEVTLWLAVTRIQPGTRHAALFYALLGSTVALSLLRLILPLETTTTGVLPAALPWVRTAIGVARQVIVLLALRAIAAGGPALPPRSSEGQRDALIGGLWLTGGLLVTFGSMSSADGKSYAVAFGAVVYGAIRLIRGLVRS